MSNSQKTHDLVFVGYTTTSREDAMSFMPDYKLPKTYKEGSDASIRWMEDKQAGYSTEFAPNSPYVGSLTSVVLASLRDVKVAAYRRLKSGTSFAANIVEWLDATYHDMVSPRDGSFLNDPVRFVGFDIRTFVKMLGIEAAESQVPLPTAFWLGADHRDLKSLLLPDCDELGLDIVLKRFASSLSDIDTAFMSKFGQGNSPWTDVIGAVTLSQRLGLMPGLEPQYKVLRNALLESAADAEDSVIAASKPKTIKRKVPSA